MPGAQRGETVAKGLRDTFDFSAARKANKVFGFVT